MNRGGMGGCPMCGRMMQEEGMPEWMMSMGPMENMMRDMPVIHNLLRHHEEIERKVEDIPKGIRSETTSENPEVTEWIRAHAHQMKERVEKGEPIRQMDPVFREIFDHHDQIRLEIEEIPDGVRVTEQSDDPQVQLLIRQHAHRAVSEFVEGGMQRAMQPTPLPQGYREEGAAPITDEDTDDPQELRRRIKRLQERLAELEGGEASPQEVVEEQPMMCPMCQRMMGGTDETTGREELEQRIRERVERLEQRAAELERR